MEPRRISAAALFGLVLLLTTSALTVSAQGDGETNPDSPFNTSYSSFEQRVNYSSSTQFQVRGMEPFYNITHMILRWFEPEPMIPEGYLIVEQNNIRAGPKIEGHDYADLVKKHWALLLVVLISALVVVLTPVIGLCFCCCRCCGGCGGRTEPFDKKHDTCRRVLLGMLLVLCCAGIVFGVVLAFMTNNYMQQGIRNATVTARDGVSDTQTFLNATSRELNFMLVKNYEELKQTLIQRLDDQTGEVSQKLERESHAVSLEQLNDFVQALPQVKGDLERTKHLSSALRTNASELNISLRQVKAQLLKALNHCEHPSCKEIEQKYKIGELDTRGIDYDLLPDVSDMIRSVDELLASNLRQALGRSKGAIDDVKNTVSEEVSKNVEKVKDALTEAGKAMQDLGDNIDMELLKFSSDTGSTSDEYLSKAEYYMKEYGEYRYYVGLAISSLLLLILICIVCGLLCGICGKRPDGYGDDCCNKGAGGRFLMIGVAIIFLTLSALVICVFVHFLLGLVLHRVTCVSLKDPQHDSVFKYVDQYVNLYDSAALRNLQQRRKIARNQATQHVKLSEVIVQCHQNKSAYQVFRLDKLFNISQILDYPNRFRIEELLEQIGQNVRIEDKVVILDPLTTSEVQRMTRSRLAQFDVHKFQDNLNQEITKYNLTELSEKLSETEQQIPSHLHSLKESLKFQALQLKLFDHQMVRPMVDSIREILTLTANLDQALKFNSNSFPEAMDKFIAETRRAEDFINTQGSAYLSRTLEAFTRDFMKEIENYLNRVVTMTSEEVARCGPISNVYNATVVASCNKIVDPINGFWAGVGWCLLLFFPTLILSVKLSTLYQKSEPYPGPSAEAEYLYDAYSERDNIPMSNGPKNKRRKDRRRDPHRDYYEDSGPSHHQGSSRDARYTDMAPNRNGRHSPPPYQLPRPTSPVGLSSGAASPQPKPWKPSNFASTPRSPSPPAYASSSHPLPPPLSPMHSPSPPPFDRVFFVSGNHSLDRRVQPTAPPKPPSPTEHFKHPGEIPRALRLRDRGRHDSEVRY